MSKEMIRHCLSEAVSALAEQGKFYNASIPDLTIDRTKDPDHGDFATNAALALSTLAKCSPHDLAQAIIDEMPVHEEIVKIEIAGPGFINFFLKASKKEEIVKTILSQGEQFGCCDLGKGIKVHMEFVSANPTGPLHVGHGRGAAYGATLVNVLKAAGFDVFCEYYVNDAGRQMNILALSVWLRYLSFYGEDIEFPQGAYQGGYIKTIARTLQDNHRDNFLHPASSILSDLSASPDPDNMDPYLDALVERTKLLLGETDYAFIYEFAIETITQDIREDLSEFGVVYDNWFSEKSLLANGAVDRALAQLKQSDCLYEREGAVWFNASRFGDDKDRVLIRANGQHTYFMTDIAYHFDKYKRGFERVIDIFGADHHGYVARIKASVDALGGDSEHLTIRLVQFAVLYRGAEKVSMSTRSGEFVTLRTLREEVGNDAARFFYVLRKSEQHMDFDLELAKSQSNENPIYYIQYAHARICSVMRQLGEKNLEWDEGDGLSHLSRLTSIHETSLMGLLARYPEMIAASALHYEPHQIAHFLRELAQGLHTYYNSEQFIVDDVSLRNARLALILAVKTVLNNGLQLLGVSAPETM